MFPKGWKSKLEGGDGNNNKNLPSKILGKLSQQEKGKQQKMKNKSFNAISAVNSLMVVLLIWRHYECCELEHISYNIGVLWYINNEK